jgi:hypothetical protein
MEKKTTIYVLASFLLIAIGLVLLFAIPQSNAGNNMAVSFISGGISSLAFAVIRYFDDLDESQQFKELDKKLNDMRVAISNTTDELQALRGSSIITDDSNKRCSFNRQLAQEFNDAVNAIPRAKRIYVDMLGVTLHRFYKEALEGLLKDRSSTVRLIVQSPAAQSIKIIADQEGYDSVRLIQEVLELTEFVVRNASQNANEHGLNPADIKAKFTYSKPESGTTSDIELRWFSEVASVSIIRINDILFVRPRFLDEGRDAPIFFERYRCSEGRTFRAYEEFFNIAWNRSILPSGDDLKEALPQTRTN